MRLTSHLPPPLTSHLQVEHIWDWTENAFFDQISGEQGQRVFLRTYNQVVGSVRLETTRVTSDSCAYKHSAWSATILSSRRPSLLESEGRHPECFGPREYGIQVDPYGPRWDPTKWASELHGTEHRCARAVHAERHVKVCAQEAACEEACGSDL